MSTEIKKIITKDLTATITLNVGKYKKIEVTIDGKVDDILDIDSQKLVDKLTEIGKKLKVGTISL